MPLPAAPATFVANVSTIAAATTNANNQLWYNALANYVLFKDVASTVTVAHSFSQGANFSGGTVNFSGAAVTNLSGANITALNASSLASGTVPDARFPSTLPALSGVNLTALNASNLGSGNVPSARVSGAYNNITHLGELTSLTVAGNLAVVGTLTGGDTTLGPTTLYSLNVGDTVSAGNISFDGTATFGNVVPRVNVSLDLGVSGKLWRNVNCVNVSATTSVSAGVDLVVGRNISNGEAAGGNAGGGAHLCGSTGGLEFFYANLGTGYTRQTVSGSRGGNAALGNLLTALDAYGLIHNTTTA